MDTKIKTYFPEQSEKQINQFAELKPLYDSWNQQINVISRTDMTHFYIRHVLHSLGIAKVLTFKPQTSVLDVGTGGGFPGIPLAIMFPETQFTLVDSVGKKIKVVQAIADALALDNVKAYHKRAEDLNGAFDFVVSRAVTRMERFVPWVQHKIKAKSKHSLSNGILYLKGGDLKEELKPFSKAKTHDLAAHYKEDFFKTKKVVHLSL
ncbi:MAG: 16S rRNA (guanine(527)-N(7))-methyltransferase RsmG [Flavobacteriaceae bacterium]|jgi:16S rRNA (guanine527-N7)-methyltransferase|tara:strand:- start:1218 stop:1838 length:621 start_codon:yes stop_codon:yes gene_type:complete